jgi:ribose transport system substrate-binding protein
MVVGVLGIAACGGDDDDEGGGASAEATATQEQNASTGPTIDELTGEGSYEAEPPTEGPPPAKGKKVWWISCGQAVPDCAEPAAAAKEAAEKLGFEFNIADGKLNAAGGNATALRTALAAEPDAVAIHGIACPVIKGPLAEAKRQGVQIIGVEALDCSAPPTNGDSLFTADMKYAPKMQNTLDYFKAWGTITAQYMIASLGGKAKIINNHGTDPLMEAIETGFAAEIKKCSGCEIVDELQFNSSDQIPNGPYVQRVRAAVTKNPDATAMNMLFDANIVSAGGQKAAAELNPKLKLFGGSGQKPVLDLIRQDKVVAAPASHSPEWMGWGAMDNVNRLLNDQETVPQGVGFRPVDKTHNLPEKAGTSYISPIDFKAAYEKLWSSGS